MIWGGLTMKMCTGMLESLSAPVGPSTGYKQRLRLQERPWVRGEFQSLMKYMHKDYL